MRKEGTGRRRGGSSGSLPKDGVRIVQLGFRRFACNANRTSRLPLLVHREEREPYSTYTPAPATTPRSVAANATASPPPPTRFALVAAETGEVAAAPTLPLAMDVSMVPEAV